MELRPVGYVTKRGMDPSDAIPYKRDRNYARDLFFASTTNIQKLSTEIKHNRILCSVYDSHHSSRISKPEKNSDHRTGSNSAELPRAGLTVT